MMKFTANISPNLPPILSAVKVKHCLVGSYFRFAWLNIPLISFQRFRFFTFLPHSSLSTIERAHLAQRIWINIHEPWSVRKKLCHRFFFFIFFCFLVRLGLSVHCMHDDTRPSLFGQHFERFASVCLIHLFFVLSSVFDFVFCTICSVVINE